MQPNSFEAGLKFVPIIYACTLFVNVTPVCNQIFAVVAESMPEDWVAPYPTWAPVVISVSIGLGCGIITGVFVAFVVVPRQKKSILLSFTQLEETHDRERLEAEQDADEKNHIADDGNQ